MKRIPALFALLLAGCLHRVPPQHLAQPVPIAVAMLEDRGGETRALPDDVRARVAQELDERNLIVREIAPEPLLGGARNSQQRFAALQAASGDAAFALLVETRVAYYDLLEGQYRWVIYAKITAGRRGAQLQPAIDDSDIPVFLLFDHEREDEALKQASRILAEKAAALLDGFIAPAASPHSDAAALPASRAGQASPDGVRGLGNIYFVLVDRFAAGQTTPTGAIDRADPEAFHGGDLQGVVARLDELQSLGVKTVWLSPVFASRQEKFVSHGAYHGYWVEDINRIEPRFGDVATLQKLSSELHRRGMKLMLDLVLNHVAFDSPLLAAHPDWFHHQGSIQDWNSREQLEQRDVDGLPDLAQENEEVYRYLADASIHWIDSVHPDGFRLDAVKHVPTTFWRRFNAEMRAHAGPQFLLLGEALEGDPVKLAQVGREGGFDSLFDFPLSYALGDLFCKGAAPERLAAIISLDRLYPDAAALVGVVDNHDLPRITSLCGNDEGKVAQALAALAFLRAVPAIQYGTEAALSGMTEPGNRGDLFERTDAHARAGVQAALAAGEQMAALTHQRAIPLAAGSGAIALARVEGDRAALLLYARAGAHVPSLAELIPAQAGARIERCSSWTLPSSAGLPCAGESAPEEVRIYWLRSARSDGFADLLHEAPLRQLRFALDSNPAGESTGAYYLAGAGPELGDWDPTQAIGPLPRGAAAAPVTIQLPSRSVAEYKLILKRPDGSVQWESGPDRFLFVSSANGPLEVRVAWRT